MAKSEVKASIDLGIMQDRLNAAKKTLRKANDKLQVAANAHIAAKQEFSAAFEALEAGTRVVLGG